RKTAARTRTRPAAGSRGYLRDENGPNQHCCPTVPRRPATTRWISATTSLRRPRRPRRPPEPPRPRPALPARGHPPRRLVGLPQGRPGHRRPRRADRGPPPPLPPWGGLRLAAARRHHRGAPHLRAGECLWRRRRRRFWYGATYLVRRRGRRGRQT